MHKSSSVINVIVVAVALILIVLLGFQLYNYFYLSVQTEFAVEATMEDTFDVNGIVSRSEHVLHDNTSGYHDIVLSDGEKVAKGGTIACIYGQESDVKAQEKIRLLQAQIDEYMTAISAKASYAGDSSAYEQSIQNSISEYSGALHQDDAFTAQESLAEFEKNVYIKEIVTGSNNDYQRQIMSLRSEISALQATISGSVRNMTADESGFYCRVVDGFEEKLTPQTMDELKLEEYYELFKDVSSPSAAPTDNVGKIVSTYDWHYYFVAPAAMDEYSVGEKIYFRFPSVTQDTVEGKITSMKQDGDNILIGVICSAVHPEFLTVRTLEGVAIAKTYSGIRVNKNSVRIVDGENGIYVKVGSIVKFKKVKVLYMGTSYALLDSSGDVANFDEVIVSGKNIYDGKVLS